MRCAVCTIAESIVVSIIMAQPTDPAQDGCFLVGLQDDQPCDIGWVYDGTGFYSPNPPLEPTLTPAPEPVP